MVDLPAAASIVRQCVGAGLSVVAMHELRGGMINRVQEWRTDGVPSALVAKVNDRPADAAALHEELVCLRWCAQHTNLPVPRVYGCVSVPGEVPLTCLLMERLPGRSLWEAQLTPVGRKAAQAQIAQHLASLHEHGGDRYGRITESLQPGSQWLSWFAPKLQSNYADARQYLSPELARTVEKVLSDLPRWLPEPDHPTAVHGDIWAANIILDDADPDRPTISGFVDGGGLFADVEYEQAYVGCFPNADTEVFFQAYREHRALRPGYERRFHVYWLNTLLLHVWMFGPDEYLPRCQQVIRDLTDLM